VTLENNEAGLLEDSTRLSVRELKAPSQKKNTAVAAHPVRSTAADAPARPLHARDGLGAVRALGRRSTRSTRRCCASKRWWTARPA
jgi:hypothetical protein